jgi:hypothetical protein
MPKGMQLGLLSALVVIEGFSAITQHTQQGFVHFTTWLALGIVIFGVGWIALKR